MSPQLKKDIKTIVAVLAYIAFYVAIGLLAEKYPLIIAVPFLILFSFYIYRRYIKKIKTATFLFATANESTDNQLLNITAIIFFLIAALSYLLWNANLYFCLVLLGMGMLSYLSRFMKQPGSKLVIEGNRMRIFGTTEIFDTRSVKQIVLKSDKIIVVKENGERAYGFGLELTADSSAKLIQFLNEKLPEKRPIVINEV